MVTVGVGIRLTYCQRSWGCLFAAAVKLGDVALGMLAVVLEEADCSVCGVAGMPANAGKWTIPLMSLGVAAVSSRSWGSLL